MRRATRIEFATHTTRKKRPINRFFCPVRVSAFYPGQLGHARFLKRLENEFSDLSWTTQDSAQLSDCRRTQRRAEKSGAFWNFAPRSRRRVSSSNGMTSVRRTAFSSLSVKLQTHLPSTTGRLPVPLADTRPAGPWHTAATIRPASNAAPTALARGSLPGRSHIVPWPPGRKIASQSAAVISPMARVVFAAARPSHRRGIAARTRESCRQAHGSLDRSGSRRHCRRGCNRAWPALAM